MKEVVVISGKGGTGKTSITAALANLWDRPVIADCDVDAADLHLLLDPDIKKRYPFISGIEPVLDKDICTECGQCREVCVYDAIDDGYSINRLNCEGCGVCFHFCPVQAIQLQDRECGEWYVSDTRFGPMVHARLGIAEENSGKLVTLIRKKARSIAEVKQKDVVLIDGSPGIGCPVISSITGASLVVLVTEPTVSGIHDMKRVFGLAAHFKVPVLVVINKADLDLQMAQQIISSCRENKIKIAGQIPYDPVFTRAMVQGQTVFEYDGGKKCPVCENIQSISDQIQNRLLVSEMNEEIMEG